ncbi:hypothetical protein Y032_0035g3061 [Ancylostoma ceylanicum]|uniref:Uncharacterized protein n=1 Tax=Ancylostoma ceylanicum TaxID=53326 RepID=A0A016UL49_9BILA|nr:hypothetical protein Y032_0035g3061 [Ancylostoma ceylanicum]
MTASDSIALQNYLLGTDMMGVQNGHKFCRNESSGWKSTEQKTELETLVKTAIGNRHYWRRNRCKWRRQ